MRWGNCQNETCGKFRKLYKSKKSEKYICSLCHSKDPDTFKICSECNKLKSVAMARPKVLCPNCYQQSPWFLDFCKFCNEKGIVYTRDSEGNAICRKVDCRRKAGLTIKKRWRAVYIICTSCKEKKLRHTKDVHGNPLCRNKNCRAKGKNVLPKAD